MITRIGLAHLYAKVGEFSFLLTQVCACENLGEMFYGVESVAVIKNDDRSSVKISGKFEKKNIFFVAVKSFLDIFFQKFIKVKKQSN